MRAYMTLAEFQSLSGNSTTEDMIKRATLQVENALVGVVYAVTSQGIPSDADTLEAVRWAIIYQVQSLERFDQRVANADSRTSQFGGVLTSAGIGSANFTITEGGAIRTDLDSEPGMLCIRSRMTLQTAGLSSSAVGYG